MKYSHHVSLLCVVLQMMNSAVCAQETGGAVAPSEVVLLAGFEANEESFVYEDDVFDTDAPAYAYGLHQDTYLVVGLGGVDNVDVEDGMSGGWQTTFDVPVEGLVMIEVRYRLDQTEEYESSEFSQFQVKLDGAIFGVVDEISGGGSTGWQTVILDAGVLEAGAHTLTLGAYNNAKTTASEETYLMIDFVKVTVGDSPMSTPNPAPTPTTPSSDVIISADFDSNFDGFSYMDDAFRGTDAAMYAEGNFVVVDDNVSPNGYLELRLGGLDREDILGISGGWERPFTLTSASELSLSFRYKMFNSGNEEGDEISQVLASINGMLFGEPPSDIVAEISGGSGESVSTGWKTFNGRVTLSSGDHRLVVGGYINKKTASDEYTLIELDDVILEVVNDDGAVAPDTLSPVAAPARPPPDDGAVAPDTLTPVAAPAPTPDPTPDNAIISADFNSNFDQFTYVDDVFRDTDAPDYAEGLFLVVDNNVAADGSLELRLGGVDSVDIFGMSGGWERSFTLESDTVVSLSLRYNLRNTGNEESSEISQVMASIDGVLIGEAPSDAIAEIRGGNDGVPVSTGWMTFEARVGMLTAGDHRLVVGGYMNKKTAFDERTTIMLDDVRLEPVE